MTQTGVRARPSKPRRYAAQGLFFPAAAAYAAIAAPLSVYELLDGPPLLPGLASPAGHAHELLFGFALAVVAGFLITRTTRTRVYGLFALWLAARLSFLFAPMSLMSDVFNIAFAACLLTLVLPGFMKAAKKWRNQAISPILLAAAMAVLAFHAQVRAGAASEHLSLYEGVLALTLLMLFMGGRAIAPAAAGHIRLQGGHLKARVQPRLEGALLLMLGAAAILLLWQPSQGVAGVVLLAAGGVALARLIRWRPWRWFDRADLLCLGIGYAWLGIGLGLFGSALTTGILAPVTAIHAITVGALGTLTLTMMARTRMSALKRPPGSAFGMRCAVASIAGATLLRIGWPYNPVILLTASLLWSLAFAILLTGLLRSQFKTTSI